MARLDPICQAIKYLKNSFKFNVYFILFYFSLLVIDLVPNLTKCIHENPYKDKMQNIFNREELTLYKEKGKGGMVRSLIGGVNCGADNDGKRKEYGE